MATKKSFKKTGAEAVSKFFSDATLSTQPEPITQDARHTQQVQDVQVTQNEQSTLVTQDTQNAQEKNITVKDRVQSKPRINMAFDEESLDYMHVMARMDGVTITKYVNKLIQNDMQVRNEEYKMAVKFFGLKK